LSRALHDPSGRPVSSMLPGILAMLDVPLYDGRAPLLSTLDGESAAKVEFVRARTEAGLGAIDLPRSEIAASWSFRTLTLDAPMRAARDAAEIAEVPADPLDVESVSPLQAGLDFPLGALTLLRVGEVHRGFITVPDALDPLTRARRPDGRYEPRRIAFTMTIPRGHDPDEPLSVVMFAHGLMTERRFVLALGDALAAEDLAVIAIDLPYHGLRTHCVSTGPQCLINPLDTTGPQICPAACNLGDSCAPDGHCVDDNGEPTELNDWPIVGFPQASGGAFVDVDSMPGTRDHFYQAITDLSALERSLREGDWRSAIGYEIAPKIGLVGQSLGGLLGAVYAAIHPDLERAVFNVAGADVIELFRESTLFASHLDAFLDREAIVKGSEEHERVLNIGRWIMDPIDPQSFARFLLRESFEGGELPSRTFLIQMATLDVVIPNESTKTLERLSGVRREDYLAEHGFLVVPVEPAYLRGVGDVAGVLGRGVMP
jgi:pimeloyl-ACP methyl ester carboxylesterase